MADTTSEEKKKKLSRKERERELRALTSDGRGCGFKKDLVADRHLDDQRYEREIAFKKQQQAAAAAAKHSSGGKDKAGAMIPGVTLGAPPPSAAFDALIRMEAGLGQRTIHDNINDPNRPSWEDYKKAKADKLDLVGGSGKGSQGRALRRFLTGLACRPLFSGAKVLVTLFPPCSEYIAHESIFSPTLPTGRCR